MFKPAALLKNTFNLASRHSGEGCLVNYVWINESKDGPERKEACSVSFRHIDCAYENARLYPQSRVKIWIDYRFLDERSRACLKEHEKMFAPSNVEFADLNDIPRYRECEMFNPYAPQGIWGRVDLARLIVLDHVLICEPEPYAFYADFDVPDVQISAAQKLISRRGLALGKTGASKSTLVAFFNKCIDYGMLENGYFAFSREKHEGVDFLRQLLSSTFLWVSMNRNGYMIFSDHARRMADSLYLEKRESLGVPRVLYEQGYTIPKQKKYEDLGWN